jgi:hypothetical protein
VPARARGGDGDLAPASRAERGGPGRAAAQAAKPAERRGVRIAHDALDAAREHRDAFAGRAAAAAQGTDDVGLLWFRDSFLPVADETAPGDVEEHVFTFRPFAVHGLYEFPTGAGLLPSAAVPPGGGGRIQPVFPALNPLPDRSSIDA